MKKSLIISIFIICGLLILPYTSFARVTGSRHDMESLVIFPTTFIAKKGACSHCHVPHRAAPAPQVKLWPIAKLEVNGSYVTPNSEWGNSTVGSLCLTCHGLGTVLAPESAAQENPFSDEYHGRNADQLWDTSDSGWGSNPVTKGSPTIVSDMANIGDLNQLLTDNADMRIEADGDLACTSCHNVHDNSVKPFLQHFAAHGELTDFCASCHIYRSNGRGDANNPSPTSPNAEIKCGQNNTRGNHPTRIQPIDYWCGPANIKTAYIQGPNEFNVPVQASGANGPNDSWNLGGHLDNDGRIGCATCHPVHGNESDNYASQTDGATPVEVVQNPLGGPIHRVPEDNRLLVMDYYQNSTVTEAKTGYAYDRIAICEGCHENIWPEAILTNHKFDPDLTDNSTYGSGPGWANGTSHPILTEQQYWSLLDKTYVNATFGTGGYQWMSEGNPTDYEPSDLYVTIQCTSCHDIHWSRGGLVEGRNATTDLDDWIEGERSPEFLLHAACDECHFHDTPKDHHPSSTHENPKYNRTYTAGVDYRMNATPLDMIDGDTNWETYTRTNFADKQYQFPEGYMTCATCHGADFDEDNCPCFRTATFNTRPDDGCVGCHGTAHTDFQLVRLVGRHEESDMCVDCHSFNPSRYTEAFGTMASPVEITYEINGTETMYTDYRFADHYVGPIVTPKYKAHMGENGTNNQVGESGHTAWPTTNLYSRYSDDGSTGYGAIICESCHTVASPITTSNLNACSANVNDTTSDFAGNYPEYVKPEIRCLLENSGNLRTDYEQNVPVGSRVAADMCTGCHTIAPIGHTHPAQEHTTYWNNQTAVNYITAPCSSTNTSDPESKTGDDRINCESCHRPHDASSWSMASIIEAGGPGVIGNYTSPSLTYGIFTLSNQTAYGSVSNGYQNWSDFCNLCHGVKDDYF